MRLRPDIVLKKENEQLRTLFRDMHWMARRYCDGRATYATSTFNKITKDALRLGIDLDVTYRADGTVFAHDSGGRTCDGLLAEEAVLKSLDASGYYYMPVKYRKIPERPLP